MRDERRDELRDAIRGQQTVAVVGIPSGEPLFRRQVVAGYAHSIQTHVGDIVVEVGLGIPGLLARLPCFEHGVVDHVDDPRTVVGTGHQDARQDEIHCVHP